MIFRNNASRQRKATEVGGDTPQEGDHVGVLKLVCPCCRGEIDPRIETRRLIHMNGLESIVDLWCGRCGRLVKVDLLDAFIDTVRRPPSFEPNGGPPS